MGSVLSRLILLRRDQHNGELFRSIEGAEPDGEFQARDLWHIEICNEYVRLGLTYLGEGTGGKLEEHGGKAKLMQTILVDVQHHARIIHGIDETVARRTWSRLTEAYTLSHGTIAVLPHELIEMETERRMGDRPQVRHGEALEYRV